MAKILEFASRPDRLRQDQAATLKQALLPFAAELPDHVRALLTHIDRQTANHNRWTFVMLSPSQNAAVVNFLASNSTRPIIGLKLWALCFEHLDIDTGEIMLTREQIADKMGCSAAHISEIMGELVEFGAISRRRQKVSGLRGQGVVRYFMNPRVATHLAGKSQQFFRKPPPYASHVGGRPKYRFCSACP